MSRSSSPPASFRFRARNDAVQIGDALKFGWEMVPSGGDEAVAIGLELVILDPQGRIRADYQFIES